MITLQRLVATAQGDDCTTAYLLDYPYFKKYYKLIATDLSKQQKLDEDLKAIQQTNFTRHLDKAESSTMFFIFEEAKETILEKAIILKKFEKKKIQKKQLKVL